MIIMINLNDGSTDSNEDKLIISLIILICTVWTPKVQHQQLWPALPAEQGQGPPCQELHLPGEDHQPGGDKVTKGQKTKRQRDKRQRT